MSKSTHKPRTWPVGRRRWPSNPYVFTGHDCASVTVIAFAYTPTGRWARRKGGLPIFHTATAYGKFTTERPLPSLHSDEENTERKLTAMAIKHWHETAPKLPRGNRWTFPEPYDP